MKGYLELILGPMFSGKTSKLMSVYKQCTFCNIPVAVINHQLDVRYSESSSLSSHDRHAIPCLPSDSLRACWAREDVRAADVILINEGQFFPDLDVVLTMVECGKQVYIASLDGDFERKKFGTVLDLIPYADTVTKLKSLCGLCRDGTPAVFSKRVTAEADQVVIGVDNYIPVCRACY
jgi:thymidine kinase